MLYQPLQLPKMQEIKLKPLRMLPLLLSKLHLHNLQLFKALILQEVQQEDSLLEILETSETTLLKGLHVSSHLEQFVQMLMTPQLAQVLILGQDLDPEPRQQNQKLQLLKLKQQLRMQQLIPRNHFLKMYALPVDTVKMYLKRVSLTLKPYQRNNRKLSMNR